MRSQDNRAPGAEHVLDVVGDQRLAFFSDTELAMLARCVSRPLMREALGPGEEAAHEVFQLELRAELRKRNEAS